MSFQPFNYPEVDKLFGELLTTVLGESGRGAILIATEHVNEFLKKLLEEVMPKDLPEKKRKYLFRYPGPLASLSAKIEMAYTFRLINKSLYESLNALRELRNDAAHSSSNFELHELNERMKNIYKLGDAVPHFVREQSMRMLLHSKIENIKELFKEHNITDEAEKKKIIDKIHEEKHLKELEKQVPFWELINGLVLICGLIMHHKENIKKLTKDIEIWSDLQKE